MTAARNLRLLNLLTFFYSFRTYEGVWVIYFAAITGSYATALGLFSLMHIASSAAEVPTGLLSDRIGRKWTILLYCLLGLASTSLFYLAESTSVLVIGSIFVGLSMALGSGTISAFVYENLESLGKADEYKKYEGKRRAQGKYAMVIAGLLGAGIIYMYDIRTALLVSLVAVLASFVVAVWLRDVRATNVDKNKIYGDLGAAFRQFKNNVSLRDFSLGRMFARGVGNAEYRFRTLFFATLMPEWFVNILIMLNNLVVGALMHTNYFIVQKLGLKRALVGVDIVNRAVVTICAIINTAVAGVVMNFSTSIVHGISDVASEDLLQARYSKEQRATMGSLVSLGGSIIYIITAFVAGLVADQIGLLYTMLAIQPFLLISTYFFWKGLRHK